MEDISTTKKTFSVGGRVKSFGHALRGINIFLQTTHSAWIHGAVFTLVVVLGYVFSISSTEWIAIILASGFVFAAEAFNSAIEVHMDLTASEPHPMARDTKDIAAGAVLISALTALAVGLIVFLPYIF